MTGLGERFTIDRKSLRHVIAASSAGTMIEWYAIQTLVAALRLRSLERIRCPLLTVSA